MVTNIFYRFGSHRRVVSLNQKDASLEHFCSLIEETENLDRKDIIFSYRTRTFKADKCPLENVKLDDNSSIDIFLPLLGGKGGFGSLLRAIGAQIEKTTNRGACRDLSGRRLRDIKREEDLKKLIALQEKLQEEKKRRKKEKLDQLKKKTDKANTSAPIQELINMFEDHEYNRRRMEMSDIIDAAIDKGIINFNKRQRSENDEINSESSKKKIRKEDDDCNSGDEKKELELKEDDQKEDKIKSNVVTDEKLVKQKPKIKKDQLWLGLDED